MNWLDIVILILCGLMVVWGASKGVIAIVFNLAAVVVAVLLGSRFGPRVGEILIPSDNLDHVQVFVGYSIIFAAVFIVSAFVAGWISRVMGFVPLFRSFNRLAGAALGLLVGILLSFGVMVGLKQLEYEGIDEAISDSTLGSFVVENFGLAAQATRLVPEDWKVIIEERSGKLTDP